MHVHPGKLALCDLAVTLSHDDANALMFSLQALLWELSFWESHIPTKTVSNRIHSSLAFPHHKGYLWNQEL
jgi:hypothetical protein